MFQSLEDQIEVYIQEDFNPSLAAQRFFASYGEEQISKRLGEMSKMQQSIENVLKQSVRSNYSSFLQANNQITQVGQEMSELKHLIENTRKLISVSLNYLKLPLIVLLFGRILMFFKRIYRLI